MRITEIEWKEGNEYKTKNGEEFIVCTGNLETTHDGYSNIVEMYSLQELLQLELEPVIDWSTVAVDTPVWVEYSTGWKPRHFQGFDIAKMFVRVYFNGWTSHSANECVEEHHHSEVSLTKPK